SLATQGMLHLSALRNGDRFAACHLGFHQGGVLYGYMLSYDESYARCSPGTTLQDALLMWACEVGVRRIDMLRGTHEYKLRFKPEPRLLQTFVVARTLLGRLCLLAYRVQVRMVRMLRRPHRQSGRDGVLLPL
ncbi:MAG: GNAT family N-acetyltransferase, partial [Sinobacteraceae bacterium]|nr:GNAT family N-acetyltransferase [Nevskiaceae bacterium]